MEMLRSTSGSAILAPLVGGEGALSLVGMKMLGGGAAKQVRGEGDGFLKLLRASLRQMMARIARLSMIKLTFKVSKSISGPCDLRLCIHTESIYYIYPGG